MNETGHAMIQAPAATNNAPLTPPSVPANVTPPDVPGRTRFHVMIETGSRLLNVPISVAQVSALAAARDPAAAANQKGLGWIT